MYKITLGSDSATDRSEGGRYPQYLAEAIIEGCPESGLPAVDFRREAGLPSEPTNRMRLPRFACESESLARRLAPHLDSQANLEVSYGGVRSRPEQIRNYLVNPGESTVLALLIETLEDSPRRLQEAVAAIEKQKAEARQLLAPEFEALELELRRAKANLAKAEERIEELEESAI